MALIRLVEGFEGAAYIDITTDASNRITAITGRNASITGRRTDGTGPTYSRTFGNVEETMAIPTSPQGRIQLSPHRSTGLDGFDANIELFPPPG